jgi:hypothetical protein
LSLYLTSTRKLGLRAKMIDGTSQQYETTLTVSSDEWDFVAVSASYDHS